MASNLALSRLSPNDDLFIDIYQELLKHELCLMRLGDLCIKKNGFYVSASMQSAVHNVDAKLTTLDIAYEVLSLLNDYRFNEKDFGKFLDKLVESRLLIDMPCDFDYRRMVENAVNVNNVLDIKPGENPFIYYRMIDKLRRRPDYDEIKRYIKNNLDKCFKTAYGELIRLFRYETALPRNTSPFVDTPYRVLESYILPFIEDYTLIREQELFNEVFAYLINNLGQEAQYVRDALSNAGINSLDGYQAEFIKQMVNGLDKHKLVVISAPTGSGKTVIFMTYILLKLLKYGGVAVIIYPTKALAREQLGTMINILYYLNKTLSNNKIHIYIFDKDSPSRPLRNASFRGGIKIGNNILMYNSNGRVALNDQILEWIHEDRSATINEPAIVITNHAMLSLHLSKGSTWARQLVEKLNTIVVDEAHIFINDLAKSLILHFLLTRLLVTATIMDILRNSGRVDSINDIEEGIKSFVGRRRVDVIFSSATLGDRKVIDEGMTINQLGGVDLADLSIKSPPDLGPLLKWVLDLYDKPIYVDYYDKVKESSKRKRRLIVTALNFPTPAESAQNPFIEGLVSTIIWTEGVSEGLRKTYGVNGEIHALAFIDSKESQREVFRRLIERGLKQEVLHADKLLISPLMGLSTRGSNIIGDLLMTSKDPLTDPYLRTYSHLQLMLTHSDIGHYVNALKKGDRQQARTIVSVPLAFAHSLHDAQFANPILYVNTNNNIHYVALHNADLDLQLRNMVENILTSGGWRLTIATSTLELGVNIPNVAVVLQFGAPPSSESFIQRVGRAGRDVGSYKSLRISFGALFLRNAGKDISYIDETQAFKFLFNLEQPRYMRDVDDETLIRYMTWLYRDLNNINIPDRGHVLRLVVKQLYGRSANIVTEVMKLVDSYTKVENMIRNAVGSGNIIGIHSMGVIIKDLRRDINDVRSNLEDLKKALKSLGNTFTNYIDNITILSPKLEEIVRRIDEMPRSKLITMELLNIMDELNKIRYVIENINNDIIRSTGIRAPYTQNIGPVLNSLRYTIESLSRAQEKLVQLITTGVPTSSGDVSSLVDLIMGLRMPNPAINEGITGTTLMCNSASVSRNRNNIDLQCGGRSRRRRGGRSSSRRDVLRNVPFKHYK
ncbi:MAG: DEAD/DEAH box helicase [Thermoproteus sp.]